MKTTTAETFIGCNVTCPYCQEYQDAFDDLHEHFENSEPRAENVEVELKCCNCKETFIVTDIRF